MLDTDAIAELTGEVDALFARAGLEPSEPTSLRRLFSGLRLAPPESAPIRTEGVLAEVQGEPRVFYRAGLSLERARFVVGHELGHLWLERWARYPYEGEDIEERCDAFGAMVIAPRALVVRARRRWGDDVDTIADRLRTSKSVALLRFGEVFGDPSAVVRATGPIVRGDDYAWPRLDLAAAKRLRHPGIRKVALDDEPRRVGLVAA